MGSVGCRKDLTRKAEDYQVFQWRPGNDLSCGRLDGFVKSLKMLSLVIPVKTEPTPHLMRGIHYPFWILASCFRRDDVWTPTSTGETTFTRSSGLEEIKRWMKPWPKNLSAGRTTAGR